MLIQPREKAWRNSIQDYRHVNHARKQNKNKIKASAHQSPTLSERNLLLLSFFLSFFSLQFIRRERESGLQDENPQRISMTLHSPCATRAPRSCSRTHNQTRGMSCHDFVPPPLSRTLLSHTCNPTPPEPENRACSTTSDFTSASRFSSHTSWDAPILASLSIDLWRQQSSQPKPAARSGRQYEGVEDQDTLACDSRPAVASQGQEQAIIDHRCHEHPRLAERVQIESTECGRVVLSRAWRSQCIHTYMHTYIYAYIHIYIHIRYTIRPCSPPPLSLSLSLSLCACIPLTRLSHGWVGGRIAIFHTRWAD